MPRRGQARGVLKGGVIHAQLLGPLVHALHKGLLAAGDGLAQRHGAVVGADHANGLEHLIHRHLLVLFQPDLTSAHDIAIMSRELILNHPDIRQYTTIWMDSLRGGASQLVNTNKLVRFYEGATGLKTGSTDSALYCLSGTAERDGMELIAVIMKDATSAQRFADAQTLLNYGFSTSALKHVAPETPLSPVPVTLGTQATVQPVLGDGGTLLLEKAKAGDLQQTVTLSAGVKAPVALGDQLGMLTVSSGEEVVAEIPLLAGEEVPRITYGQMLLRLLRLALLSD